MHGASAGAAPEHGVVIVVGLQYVVLGLEGDERYRRILDVQFTGVGLGSGLSDLTLEHSLDSSAVKGGESFRPQVSSGVSTWIG